jgi:hypothetical protein
MENSAVGSGVMIALAAGLWLVYLVPSWLRSREYVATERNAVRLQQTLRVLAETAEVPMTVRAETTARSVAEQERVLRQQEQQRQVAERTFTAPTALQRLRRTRVATSLVLLASVVTAVVGFPLGLPLLVAFAVVIAVSALAMLSRLSSIAKSRAVAPTVAAPVQRRVVSSQRVADAAPTRTAQQQWTPVPIPKPLYLSRDVAPEAPAVPAAASVAAAASAAAELRQASLASEQAVRAAHAEPEVSTFRPPSRFAAMGVIDEADLARTDIDEVLRRRRAAG